LGNRPVEGPTVIFAVEEMLRVAVSQLCGRVNGRVAD
jgi:hypothetical protein